MEILLSLLAAIAIGAVVATLFVKKHYQHKLRMLELKYKTSSKIAWEEFESSLQWEHEYKVMLGKYTMAKQENEKLAKEILQLKNQ